MGMTLSEKIIARASGAQSVKAGDIVWADVDMAMMDDILGPRVEIAERMVELGAEVWNPDKVVIISDHYTPPANAKQAAIVKFTRDWAQAHGVENYYEYIGPCHQIMVEKGHVLPGSVVMGTDSHTCMGGALGAFSSGIGSTEMVGILVNGQIWLRVPETIRVIWEGNFGEGVMAKDLSLATIGKIGHAGATYKTVEYTGSTIDGLNMDERFCITNMAVEMGAKAGLMNTDAVTDAFFAGMGKGPFERLASDGDAVFCETLRFDATALGPKVSCPHEVDNVLDIGDAGKGIRVDQAYLGSCTGGRYTDLSMAAKLIKGKKVKHGRRLLVSPASKNIWEQAAKAGILKTLSEAGAVIMAPTCGVCVGLHSGILADGEVCVSSTNRNFVGRMGSKKAFTYLGSPLTVAAAAIAGELVDPREFF
ncbi:MAG: 3-isopropylmalate dehydratase large subunit [Desulfovibrio sp.]|jgi:3-isopropylmalate/(R)-2-methylmalate dehydratase large subunit|nr:3-isopropylmalate dehydratase large subunit [Desulfovibrio sp.]